MKLPHVILVSGALLGLAAAAATACPEGASAQCSAHKARARHAQSASTVGVAAEATSAGTVLAAHTSASAPAHTASREQRCQPFGQACDTAPTTAATTRRGACCDDASSATHAASSAPAMPAATARTVRSARHTAKNAGAEADAPAFGPLFLAPRTMML